MYMNAESGYAHVILECTFQPAFIPLDLRVLESKVQDYRMWSLEFFNVHAKSECTSRPPYTDPQVADAQDAGPAKCRRTCTGNCPFWASVCMEISSYYSFDIMLLKYIVLLV